MKLEPLAYRMRPQKIEDVLGQKHLLSKGKPLFQMIQKGHLSSMILYGRPGIGKTSIANAIAGSLHLPFRKLNAVTNNKKDLEQIVKEAESMRKTIILSIDELHRFTKTQIEFLLPYIENGQLILIGLTSENPYHHINPAIRSRCQIFELKPLQKEDIITGLKRAVCDPINGLGTYDIETSDEIFEWIAEMSGGDLRNALNKLEITFLMAEPADNGKIRITKELVQEAIQRNDIAMDKMGDFHYDALSAFHKSLRGGDVDAALLYLALLIEAGDLIGISRRILCVAYEDVGLAKPEMGTRAVSAIQAAERLGFPEAQIPLANIVIELCLSPKSNRAYVAIQNAMKIIQKGQEIEIPLHLKDAHYQGAKKLDRGIHYKYPHDYQIGKFGGWIPQQYLPTSLVDQQFYEPLEAGQEERFKKIYEKLKKEQIRQLHHHS